MRHRTTVSWIVYVPSILLAVIALATLVAGVNLHDMEGLLWGGAVLLALAAVSNFISAWFRRWTTEIAITDRRVILKHGFIRRATMEMNLAKVESIDVDQTLTGRLFNYGNVTIRGTGSSNSPHDRRAAETADDGDHELTGRFCAQLDVARLA